MLNLQGPVRGTFTPTGARRALDLAEVRLPLGRSLQGLLVLLIAGHDRSATAQPKLLSLPFPSPASSPPTTLWSSFTLLPPYLPPLWPISSPLFYPPFLYLSCRLFPFFLPHSVFSVVWLRVSYERAAAGGTTLPHNYISFYYLC